MYWKIIQPLTCRTFVNTFLMNLLILFHQSLTPAICFKIYQDSDVQA